jgi:hypothetical protein
MIVEERAPITIGAVQPWPNHWHSNSSVLNKYFHSFQVFHHPNLHGAKRICCCCRCCCCSFKSLAYAELLTNSSFVYCFVKPPLAGTESRNKDSEIWQDMWEKDINPHRGYLINLLDRGSEKTTRLCLLLIIKKNLLAGPMQILSGGICILLSLLPFTDIWSATWLCVCEASFPRVVYPPRYSLIK